MNIPSLLRSLRKKFFGSPTARRKPFRRSLLDVEPLESRIVPAVQPTILSVQSSGVTIGNLSTWSSQSGAEPTANPNPLQVFFNTAMFAPTKFQTGFATSAANPANYMLFNDTTGAAVTINKVTYADTTVGSTTTHIATLTYNIPTGGSTPSPLQDGTYTLFVKGNNLFESTDTVPISPSGQMVVVNTDSNFTNQSTVSTINYSGSGVIGAAETYPLSQDSSTGTATTPVPNVVAIADLNGDGLNDIAIANAITGSVEVFLRQSNGGYDVNPDATLYLANDPLAATTLITGIVAAKLGQPNGAGSESLADLAVVDSSGNLNVFVNDTATGSTTLSFANNGVGVAYAAGTSPVGLVAGQWLGTGKGGGSLGLAVANNGADANKDYDVTILPGNGDGTLGTAVTIIVGASTPSGLVSPTGLAVGNLNGDTKPDLAVVGATGMLPLLNTSSGGNITFSGGGATSTPIGVDSSNVAVSFSSVAIGVLAFGNTSSHADIAATSVPAAGSDSDLYVFTNSGTGTFTNAASTAVTLTGAGAVQSLVLQFPNGFNGLEMALAVSPSTNSFVALADQSAAAGTAGLAFADPVLYQTDYNPVALASADVMDGSSPDVVTVNVSLDKTGAVTTGPSFSVVAGNGDGTFNDATTVVETVTPPTHPATFPDPTSVTVGDLNGDGIPDLVVLDSGANRVGVFLADPANPGDYLDPTYYSVLDSSGNGGDPVAVTLANLTGTFYASGAPVLDIATADQTVNSTTGDYYISVLPNNADTDNTDTSGGFGSATTTIVGQLPTDIAAGLFDASNSKTAQDLIISHDGLSSKGVTFLHNTTTDPSSISFAVSEIPITTSNLDFDPSNVAVGDFNNDGNLDFVLLSNDTIDGVYNIYLVEGNGKGAFPQVLGPYALNQFITPSALAVGDFNRDGYLDVVVVGAPANGATDEIETLLNNHGFGFQNSPVLTDTALLGSAVPYTVAVTDINQDPYPDIVVGTVFTALTASNPATVENLFTFTGNGDGTFDTPIPYTAGGEPTPIPSPTAVPAPANIAIVSDPFIAVVTFNQAGPLVTVNLINNGNFATADLSGEAGNFDGWQTASVANSEGAWIVQQKTSTTGGFGKGGSPVLSPLSNTTIVNPLNSAQYQALLDERNLIPYVSGKKNPNLTGGPGGGYNDSYNGTNVLYQRIFIPPTYGTGVNDAASLSLSLYVNNTTGKWFSGPSGNPLNFDVPTPNEQVLIDFIADGQNVATAASLTGGLLYQTSATESAVFSRTLTFDLSSFLAAYAGKYIDLRIAGVNNQAGPLIVGVGNVKLTMTFQDTGNPTLSGLQMRNPGSILASNNYIPTTSDPTIIGRIGDAGGIGTIASAPGFVQFYTTNTTLSSGFEFTYTTKFDAFGNFAVTIPNLAYGLDTVTITVENQAGSFIQQTLTFFYQGPSVGGWQSVGPGAISTAGTKGITYSTVSGRVTATAVDPTDPSGNTIYVGTENGGVWKTADGGANWTPLTDFVTNQAGQPINIPVGAIAVAKNGDVYVGTGDGNVLPDAIGGNGILVSTDGGFLWSVDGDSGTSLAGARITAMAVDPTDPNIVYVAVAAGGSSGPGVYRDLNALGTAAADPNTGVVPPNAWVNILTPASMGLAATTTLASVTSLVLNPSNSHQLTIGLGNIGLVAVSTTAGIWLTPEDKDPSGAHWSQLLGGDNAAIKNDTVPSGKTVGRVTLAEGFDVGTNEPVFYALIGNTTSATPVSGGSESFGSGTGATAGLYKSSDVGKDWTKVMLEQQTGVQGPDTGTPAGYAPSFSAINLLGEDAGNAGSLQVDPTDPNIVYVGGSTGFDGGNSLDHGLIEVDTGDMFDAANYASSPAGVANDGDSMTKYNAAQAAPFSGYYDPTADAFAYSGEGVSWYDLSTGTYEGLGAKSVNLPAQVLSMTLDPQGRLIVGTEEGIWRIDAHGIPTDFTSGGGQGFRVGGILSIGKGGLKTPTANVHVATLNGNLQISDLTSVAIDPQNVGTYYAAGYGTGTERSTNSSQLSWQTMGLTGAQGQVDAGTVLTAAPDPTAPAGTPTTLYVNYAYTSAAAGFDPESSTQGGALGSFSPAQNKGISVQDTAGFFPVLVIDPNKIFDTGKYQDELLFGTDNVYTTRTSTNAWLQINPGTSLKKGDVVTAAAIAPSNSLVLYVATSSGAVFVTQNNGADGFPERDSGLPTGQPGAIATGFAIDPTNPLIAYVTFGGLGNYSHVFMTTNGGQSWTSIQGNLPNVPAFSFVTDPRKQAAAGAPNGHLYIGTEVGAFVSVNGGTTWTPLGQGLPNVPVVSLDFNQSVEQLVAGTQGRGVFVISTDRDGGHVTTVTPSVPALPPMSSVTVTFNKSIASFPVSQVTKITGPSGVLLATTSLAAAMNATQKTLTVASTAGMPTSGSFRIQIGSETLLVLSITVSTSGTTLNVQRGAFGTTAAPHAKGAALQFGSFLGLVNVTDVTPVIQGQSNKHNQFKISFPTQTSDGLYTFSIGPAILDNVGNQMDQNQNGTIGGYTFQVVLNSTDDGQFVTGLYHDLLGTGPTTAQFIAALNGIDPTRFAALLSIASPLVSGVNARTELIDELYSSSASPMLSSLGIGNLLPDDPNLATDEAASLTKLKNGASIESIISSIVTNLQFYSDAGTADPGDTPDTAWIKAMIVDLIGPTANANDVTTYSTQLTNAEKTKTAQAARVQVANAILASTEYKKQLITTVFQDYLNRAPTAADFTTWVPVVGTAAAAAGALTGDEQLLRGVFAKQEYFMDQTDTSGLHTNQSWANSLYTNLQITGFYTSAALTAAEAATDTSVLNAYATQRQTAAKSLLNGNAYRTIVINNTFLTYTGVAPTAAQLSGWLTNFANGQTQENLFAALIGTANFKNYSTTILGLKQIPTPTTIVEAAFTLLFPGFVYTTNNPASNTDISYWTKKMASGMTQAQVAAGLLALPIHLGNSVAQPTYSGLISRLYQQYTGVAATAAQITTWTTNFKNGQHDEALIASLLATPIYFNQTHTFP